MKQNHNPILRPLRCPKCGLEEYASVEDITLSISRRCRKCDYTCTLYGLIVEQVKHRVYESPSSIEILPEHIQNVALYNQQVGLAKRTNKPEPKFTTVAIICPTCEHDWTNSKYLANLLDKKYTVTCCMCGNTHHFTQWMESSIPTPEPRSTRQSAIDRGSYWCDMGGRTAAPERKPWVPVKGETILVRDSHSGEWLERIFQYFRRDMAYCSYHCCAARLPWVYYKRLDHNAL